MREKWNYFLGKINFGASALDAKSFQIMNELGTEMDEADKKIAELKDEVIQWNELAIAGKPFSVDNEGCRKRIEEIKQALNNK